MRAIGYAIAVLFVSAAAAVAADPPHPVMKWVKRHPLPGAKNPSPRMGYETSYGYDPLRRLLIRYGGHNQGGGGEQNSEVWTYDLEKDLWTLKEPNDAPPGVCCAQMNVFHDALRKFVRFPAFSGSHGWQSFREIYLKNSSVWTYDLDTNTWRAMRPSPECWPSPLRGAAWDVHHEVIVLHGGEGSGHGTVVYDLHANAWHILNPKPAPPANVSQPGFTYDAVNRVFVLFGSQFASDPTTWIYDLRSNTWSRLEVPSHPPADKTSPVLAADTRNGIVLCNLRNNEKLETWALDVAKRSWTHLKLEQEPDPSGSRNRVLLYLPDQNLFVLENRTHSENSEEGREQQIWTFRWAEAPAPAPAPRNLRATTTPDSVKLSWEPPADAGKVSYNVYRSRAEKPWLVQWQQAAKGVVQTTWTDQSVKNGELWYYQVRSVDDGGRESAPSFIVRSQPPVVEDVVVSVIDAKRVEVEWKEPAADDIAGYVIERAPVSAYSSEQVRRIAQRYKEASDLAVGRIKYIGTFVRLNAAPLSAARFVDESIDLAAGMKDPQPPYAGGSPLRKEDLVESGRPYKYAIYAYRVYAVNKLGVMSGPSPFVFTYPSAVQWVFSKEEGTDRVRLKWQANREKGIRGYFVYRHESRWDKDPIVRLTPQPLAATEFLDENSGRGTRRYEIVAVDALGQEGEPSQPVWSRREWRAFYVPFVGEWHQ